MIVALSNEVWEGREIKFDPSTVKAADRASFCPHPLTPPCTATTYMGDSEQFAAAEEGTWINAFCGAAKRAAARRKRSTPAHRSNSFVREARKKKANGTGSADRYVNLKHREGNRWGEPCEIMRMWKSKAGSRRGTDDHLNENG